MLQLRQALDVNRHKLFWCNSSYCANTNSVSSEFELVKGDLYTCASSKEINSVCDII
jgi:hypothetical protein